MSLIMDDSMLSLSDIAVNPEPVAESFPWELFEPVRVRYEQARFRRLKRQMKKANGQIKKKRGRPPSGAQAVLRGRAGARTVR